MFYADIFTVPINRIIDRDFAAGVIVAGHYDDSLRKVNGAWKFTKRSIVIDHPPAGGVPAATVPGESTGKP